ncbi:MAG TPA: hypothetical protein VFZ53_18670 [Polyangiaceae bacterium]
MSDPARFVDEHPSALARSLLAAGVDDEPPPALFERTLAPLGLGVMTAVISQTAQATTTGAAATTATLAPPAATAAGAGLFVTTVKWVGIAGIGGGLIAGGATALSTHGAAGSPPPAATQAAPVAAARALSPPAALRAPGVFEPALREHPSEPAAFEAISSPAVVTRRSPAGPRSSAAAEATRRSALLTEEARLIDEAREAVATGDGARALRALRLHRQRFDKPLLLPEALFLEMRALAARGDPTGAKRAAAELLRRYPNGTQAAAARRYLRAEAP